MGLKFSYNLTPNATIQWPCYLLCNPDQCHRHNNLFPITCKTDLMPWHRLFHWQVYFLSCDSWSLYLVIVLLTCNQRAPQSIGALSIATWGALALRVWASQIHKLWFPLYFNYLTNTPVFCNKWVNRRTRLWCPVVKLLCLPQDCFSCMIWKAAVPRWYTS